jgi:hypothetical protein
VKKIVTLLCALFLVGCAAVEKQAFNRDANKSIKTIAFIEPRPQTGYGISIISHPSLHFGLIGATLYATEMATKSNTLDKALKPIGWSLTDALTLALVKELEDRGYKVIRIDLKRDKLELIKDYADHKSSPAFAPALQADAWLDFATRDPLYIAASTTTDYLPSIGITARMVNAKDQTVIFREDYLYGLSLPHMQRLQPVFIASDAQYKFEPMDKLIANPQITVNGLKEGVAPLVKRIADDLAPAR